MLIASCWGAPRAHHCCHWVPPPVFSDKMKYNILSSLLQAEDIQCGSCGLNIRVSPGCNGTAIPIWGKAKKHTIWASFWLGLYTDLVFLVSIWLVFLGIYQTGTGGKLRPYILVLYFLAGTPFFLERGVMAPFLRGPAPILRKKEFPAKP